MASESLTLLVMMFSIISGKWKWSGFARRPDPTGYCDPLSGGQELIRVRTSLLENGPQCSLWHVPGMIRYGCVPVRSLAIPDLMASSRLPVKAETGGLEPSNDVAVTETAQTAHQNPTTSG